MDHTPKRRHALRLLMIYNEALAIAPFYTIKKARMTLTFWPFCLESSDSYNNPFKWHLGRCIS